MKKFLKELLILGFHPCGSDLELWNIAQQSLILDFFQLILV